MRAARCLALARIRANGRNHGSTLLQQPPTSDATAKPTSGQQPQPQPPTVNLFSVVSNQRSCADPEVTAHTAPAYMAWQYDTRHTEHRAQHMVHSKRQNSTRQTTLATRAQRRARRQGEQELENFRDSRDNSYQIPESKHITNILPRGANIYGWGQYLA